jgi:hypothetical protein
MYPAERRWECCKIISECGGFPLYICKDCKAQGWISLAGTSGGNHCENINTGEIRVPVIFKSSKS